jgi:RHS repeat-associated protein
MHTRQEETVMQLNNNDNITHLINPVKQNRWHTQVITLLMTVYMLITASFAMADVPSASATLCASEDQTCVLPAGVTATVWYGADTRWSIQSNITGSIDCSNNVFGDPAFGTVKNCYYEVTSSSSNVLPTVTLTSPSNNSSYTQGDSIPFAATAADSDGTIAKVEFFDGTTLIYTATTAPYSVGVTATTVGSHTVTAVATDNNGASTTSNAALVTITSAPVNSTPQAYYIHTDQLNTPRLITDNNNQAVWRWDNWEPFGNYITDEDPSNIGNHFTFNLRFPGQYFDSETQTHYNYFRDYDPSTGRYLQSDPIGLDGGINTYGYVNGSPLAYRDSTGLVIETIWDVGNVIYDIATGDWTALAVDTAAMCTPFVPAGITKLGKIEKGLEKTPTTHPKDFEPVRGCSAKRCKETKEIFDKDKLHKDHYEVYKDKKDFDKGKRNRDVYFDGRPKRKF